MTSRRLPAQTRPGHPYAAEPPSAATMSTRLLHVVAPTERQDAIDAVLRPVAVERWNTPADEERGSTMAVLPGSAVDEALDLLKAALDTHPPYAVAVTAVEALLEERPPPGLPLLPPPTLIERFFSRNRLSTEELYDDILDGTQLTATFIAFVVTSAVIAALGMRSGQTAVVIGAMVIAPFLSPAMAMAMAATVGDAALGRQAILVTTVGAAVAFAATVALGAVIQVDPSVPELAARTVVSPADIGLALASGVAGVTAFCRGLSASLVGVMIAVALVPPLAAAGLLIGSGHPDFALAALLLFATNLVCINTAGILTFLIQGLPPSSWRMTGSLLALWGVLLAALSVLIASAPGL